MLNDSTQKTVFSAKWLFEVIARSPVSMSIKSHWGLHTETIILVSYTKFNFEQEYVLWNSAGARELEAPQGPPPERPEPPSFPCPAPLPL